MHFHLITRIGELGGKFPSKYELSLLLRNTLINLKVICTELNFRVSRLIDPIFKKLGFLALQA